MVTVRLKNDASKKIPEASLGFFDKIVCVIAQEIEFKKTKNILLGFMLLLAISLVSLPFSLRFVIEKWNNSGVQYFISTALENRTAFLALWQDFLLSIFESLPVLSIIVFSLNVVLLLFAIRLFVYKKGLLIKYVKHTFA